VARVDAVRVKAEDNPVHKVRDRDAARGKASHVRMVQVNRRVQVKEPDRADPKVRVRENPSRHPVRLDSHAQVEIALPAQAMYPVMFNSPWAEACRHPCTAQADADDKNPNPVAIWRCSKNINAYI